MPFDSPAPKEDTFAKYARSLGGLSGDEISAIVELSVERQLVPWQVALEQEKLTAADVDIIKTLLAPRDSIPGYEVLDLIGRGGMGVVYRARQLSLNREVALKTILLSQLGAPVAAARFENEAQVLARVIHPHIVTAFDFGRHAGRLFLAMELVQGRDVQALIEHHGALPETLVWHIIRQAAAGLAHASKANIIHRDIKPANLLLVNPPDGFALPAGIPMVKIADFGLSILGDDQQSGHTRLTSVSVHIGSPTYMAPEQLESDDIDHAADIFALGATAWHMFVGRPPLAGNSLKQLVLQRLTQPTPTLTQHVANCSPATSQLVEQMLEIDPRRRLRQYDELLRRIGDILAERPKHPGFATTQSLGLDLPSVQPNFSDQAGDNNADSPTQLFSPNGAFRDPSSYPVGLETSAEERSTAATAALSSSSLESLSMNISPAQTQSSPAKRRAVSRWLWLALPILLALLLAGWTTLGLFPPASPERPSVATGLRQALFDGHTLTNWSVVSGSWSPDEDGEGAAVLQGTNGTIRRLLSDESLRPLSDHFAIEATCSLSGEASARFKLQARTTEQEPMNLLVELRSETLLVFVQTASSEPRLQSQTRLTKGPDNIPDLRGLRFERQAAQWWIMLDGQIISSFAGTSLEELAYLELSVVQGSAQFADLSIAPLIVGPRL